MRFRTISALLLLLGVCRLLAPAGARAQERWLLGLEAGGAFAIREPQRSLYRPGGELSLTLHRSVSSGLLFGLRGRALLLLDGPPPAEALRLDPSHGSLVSASLLARLRLFGGGERRGTGAWLELGAGMGVTGPSLRPVLEAGIGWGFGLGSLTLSPYARFLQIIQPDQGGLDDRDASILSFGVRLDLDDAPRVLAGPAIEAAAIEAAAIEAPAIEAPWEVEDSELDSDGDGFGDEVDGCPLEPEDADGFEDEDGCPDPDNDADGVGDASDACPMQPETLNGVEDEDGCPDDGVIEMIDDRIVLEERILFDSQRARIKRAARGIVEAVASLV
ncbi:MAG: hypothetical protein OEY14_14055, partial [Myxococcales bacterium]|nr:hypothetical protein [Myxococcales bacterium]